MSALDKVKNWFASHKPTKRRLIQLYAALLTNAQVKGFFTGNIYKGESKKACVPGLNCYSCPGAVGACPLGALQDSLAKSGTTAPAYIFGILILFGLLLGRLICGFLCPFGLIQELLYKLRTPKLRKSRFTRILSYFKYILLALTISLPVIFAGIPAFCQYVCPAGTFEGAVSLLAHPNNAGLYGSLGILFTWKFCLCVVVLVASVFIYRFFCRFICPLGAIYSLFCKIAMLGVKLDKNKCINCGLCIDVCKMDVMHVGDHECISCGECISVCPVQAISWKGSTIFIKNTKPLAQPAQAEGGKVDLLSLSRANASAVITAPAPAAEQPEEQPVRETVEQPVEEVVEQPEELAKAVEESAEQAEEEPAQERKPDFGERIKAAFRRPRFVAEFVAWTVALVVLVVALVVFNLPDKKLDKVPELNLTTYRSAASESDKTYNLELDNKKIKLLYFWNTELEESVQGVDGLDAYRSAFGANLEIVAVHTLYKGERDVQAFIDGKGWSELDIVFAQDTDATNAYMHFGGDTSVPTAIAVAVKPDGSVAEILSGETALDAEKVKNCLIDAQAGTVYGVGDFCPVFEIKCYNTGDEEKIFSSVEARGKVTVLNFWYTDCTPCKGELPEFEEVYRDYAGEINMVAIHNVDSIPPEGVEEWIQTHEDKNGLPWKDYTLTFAQDEARLDLATMLGGRGAFPITVIVNAEGIITFVSLKATSEADLRAAIEAAK